MRLGITLIAALGLVAGASGAWAGESGKWRGKAVLTNTFLKALDVADAEGHQLMLGEEAGLVFNEDGNAFLDKADYRVQWAVDTGGMIAGGYKAFTAANGDKVFAKFAITKFRDNGVDGTWEFTGGTGGYTGISGKGTFVTTNVSDEVFWDMLEGEYAIP